MKYNATHVDTPLAVGNHGPISRLTLSRSRALLAVYWIALAVGSHWPRLVLFAQEEGEAVFQVDKSLHVLAFAGLTWLMIRAKFAGRRATPAWSTAVAGGGSPCLRRCR